jgi:hypothetical protein
MEGLKPCCLFPAKAVYFSDVITRDEFRYGILFLKGSVLMKRSLVLLAIIILTAGGAIAAPLKNEAAPKQDLPSAAKSTDEDMSLSGKVVETMNAGGYSYVCIENKGKKTWVAIPQTSVTVGQQISFEPGQEMKGFSSKTLNRTFDSIVFSGGAKSKPVAVSNKDQMVSEGHAGSKAAAVKSISTEAVKVEKAAGPNAYTVGEVYAQAGKLNKKTAVVKAKVVKVSAGIMGKNWIHLQDGTGDAAKSTNNLVVTSQDLPAVGDVVTVKGTVYKDKDFGAGYKYAVIMEQAKVQK